MTSVAAAKQIFLKPPEESTRQAITGNELEQWIGWGLLEDLNGQLADISSQMERQLKEKQVLRDEVETIHRIKSRKETLSIEGQNYRDLSPEEAHLLGVTQMATPQTDAMGTVTAYRMKEENFQEAAAVALELRERSLSNLNNHGEMTMIEIQSLVDQRKNALTLLSHLFAVSDHVAQSIIGNIGN